MTGWWLLYLAFLAIVFWRQIRPPTTQEIAAANAEFRVLPREYRYASEPAATGPASATPPRPQRRSIWRENYEARWKQPQWLVRGACPTPSEAAEPTINVTESQIWRTAEKHPMNDGEAGCRDGITDMGQHWFVARVNGQRCHASANMEVLQRLVANYAMPGDLVAIRHLRALDDRHAAARFERGTDLYMYRVGQLDTETRI